MRFRRLVGLSTFLALAFVGLAGRLVDLQYFSHEKYRELSEKNTQRTVMRSPQRGEILDRNGNPLAVCIPVKKVCADPSLIREYGLLVAEALAPMLEFDVGEFRELLKQKVRVREDGRSVTNRYVNLRRKVSAERWERIEEEVKGMRFHPEGCRLSKAEKDFYRSFRRYAIYALEDQHRLYPSGRLGSHVLGFAQEEEQFFNEKMMLGVTGRDGVERWFDGKLRGLEGWRVTEADVKQREIVVYREQEVEPTPGLNVVLTLDMVVQRIVEEELARAMRESDPISASAVVVAPATGEILGMATLPDFDPNRPGDFEVGNRRNRIIADQMEPGSTFKIVTIAAALNEGVVTVGEKIDCEDGRWLFNGRYLRDHHPYEKLSVEEVLVKSSNIGSAKIGIRLGAERMNEYIMAFGFGARTGITLGGEQEGQVNPVRNWDKLTISRIPMGHAVAVTQLQMVMAMSAIANGGRLMRPMLVRRLEERTGEVFAEYRPQVVREVISRGTAGQMVEMLKRVVTAEGTAEKAQLDHYTVAGKTGTAQKPDGPRGYMEGKYIASFIGFFPADAPEVCISVVLDEPKRGHIGGRTAGPVFRRIGERVGQYLKIRPDRDGGLDDPLTGVERGGGGVVWVRGR